MKILVIGATDFIGMHTAKRLFEQGHEVIGLDNFNSYYDSALKDYCFAQIRHLYVKNTYADTQNLEDEIDYKLKIVIEEGLEKFVEWYKSWSLSVK